MATTLYIYSGKGEEGRAVETTSDFERRLEVFMRTRKQPLTVNAVAAALGTKKADAGHATVTVHVTQFKTVVEAHGVRSTYRASFSDDKPWINAMPRDTRMRPAPFNRDGSCTG